MDHNGQNLKEIYGQVSLTLCHIVHHYVVLLSVWDFVQYYQEYKHWHNSITHTTVIFAFIVVWGLFCVNGNWLRWQRCTEVIHRKRKRVYMNEWKNSLVTANWAQACIRLEVTYRHCNRKGGDGWDCKHNSKRSKGGTAMKLKGANSEPKRHHKPLCIATSLRQYSPSGKGYYVG